MRTTHFFRDLGGSVAYRLYGWQLGQAEEFTEAWVAAKIADSGAQRPGSIVGVTYLLYETLRST